MLKFSKVGFFMCFLETTKLQLKIMLFGRNNDIYLRDLVYVLKNALNQNNLTITEIKECLQNSYCQCMYVLQITTKTSSEKRHICGYGRTYDI